MKGPLRVKYVALICCVCCSNICSAHTLLLRLLLLFNCCRCCCFSRVLFLPSLFFFLPRPFSLSQQGSFFSLSSLYDFIISITSVLYYPPLIFLLLVSLCQLPLCSIYYLLPLLHSCFTFAFTICHFFASLVGLSYSRLS